MFASPKFLIADDHPLFRTALTQAIQQTYSGATIVECDSVTALEEIAPQHPDTDLILLDLHIPGAKGFSGLVLLRREFPNLPVVIVSGSEQRDIGQRALDYGASGFIPKSSSLAEISGALKQILAGNTWLPKQNGDDVKLVTPQERDFASRLRKLTPQQFRILMLLGKGLLNKQIADRLNISEATVRTHMTAIFKKLGVNNRTQAVISTGYLDVEDAGLVE
jgi:DNA-binding NarL/FixJ family response regulator